MVRILQYDSKITAAAYSQRRAAEEGFDSGVATGLARLGRALSEREEGFRRAGASAMAARSSASLDNQRRPVKERVTPKKQSALSIPPGGETAALPAITLFSGRRRPGGPTGGGPRCNGACLSSSA